MHNIDLAPIAIFSYNRLEHLKRTIRSLEDNDLASSSEVFVFSDGANDSASELLVYSIRNFLKTSSFRFKSITVIERESNFGLAKSIIDGVSRLCEQFGRIIVLEDDMITSRYFLKFMNDALEKFKLNERIISIHGYVYPLAEPMEAPFFLEGADCWGWATWQRGWSLFNPSAEELYKKLLDSGLMNRFNFYLPNNYSKMLKENIQGKNNSWAIRWYASALLERKLTLYPHKSLVLNIGLDGSGTHCSEETSFNVSLAEEPLSLTGIEEIESTEGLRKFTEFFQPSNRIVARLKKIFRKFS